MVNITNFRIIASLQIFANVRLDCSGIDIVDIDIVIGNSFWAAYDMNEIFQYFSDVFLVTMRDQRLNIVPDVSLRAFAR